jgi:phosphomannomutase
MISSVSGIRLIIGEEPVSSLMRISGGFSSLVREEEILIGSDTRKTSHLIKRLVLASVLSSGKKAVDTGTVSTPALFRESRTRKRPAIMVTASHNEPEWNGLKLVLNGKGVDERTLHKSLEFTNGVIHSEKSKVTNSSCGYNQEFLKKYKSDFSGMRVALDLCGGSAIFHAPNILSSLGCKVIPLNDRAGIFSRRIDPTEDSLELLCKTVRENGCDAGFAFDSDGDRLVLVDSSGRKLSGDRMLSIAIYQIAKMRKIRKIVVSLDTTLAIRDIAMNNHAKLLWSKVGEVNVIRKIEESHGDIGGEGSSGGLVDPSFNFCRDSMVAAYFVLSCIKEIGDKAYEIGSEYYQYRIKLGLNLNTEKLLQNLKEKFVVETLDGLKVWIDENTWVLLRKSNTENVLRISSESKSRRKAIALAKKFENMLREINEE